jgi:hypothetical protein
MTSLDAVFGSLRDYLLNGGSHDDRLPRVILEFPSDRERFQFEGMLKSDPDIGPFLYQQIGAGPIFSFRFFGFEIELKERERRHLAGMVTRKQSATVSES